ncbi:ATP-grasp domain-containing protein [Nocardia iowensis]|uniref:ATP-grasp domain-containing protein n=1 Tax=Nocardia iowensis TaxID=204891 RepID=A0ABX8RZZ3_NOCIO|nr:hypothetical protein [Nocardia iowensis]QXN94716.1 hypothetical protein KV110_17680 [Nocardia iowensis]
MNYTEYIDHERNLVSYVCTEWASEAVPRAAAATVVVDRTSDTSAVLAAAIDLTRLCGCPERILALSESDLDTAARLRDYFRLPGDRFGDIRHFRDKLRMAEKVAASGIALPAFADAPDKTAILEFAARHGWPIVVKPRLGAGSRGFVKLGSEADLNSLESPATEPRLVQTFCPDPVGHIDGLWTGCRLGAWRASRYLAPPAEYLSGRPKASVEIDDMSLLAAVGKFAHNLFNALSSKPLIFHLEFFIGRHDDRTPRVRFLEIGARVGGTEIPAVWQEVHNRDLFAVATDLQLGRPAQLASLDDEAIGGWLVVPIQVSRPCTVVTAELDLPAGAGPYAQVMPSPGAEIPAGSRDEHVGPRFRFSGPSSAVVAEKIRRTVAALRLEYTPRDQLTFAGYRT